MNSVDNTKYSTAKKPRQSKDHSTLQTTTSAKSANYQPRIRRTLNIHLLTQAHIESNGIVIDESKIGICSLIGKSINIEDATDYFKLWINDRTGIIAVILLRGLQLSRQFEQLELIEGKYYKVHASPRIRQGELMLYCQSKAPVTDFNQVSLHMADTIVQHLRCQPKPR